MGKINQKSTSSVGGNSFTDCISQHRIMQTLTSSHTHSKVNRHPGGTQQRVFAPDDIAVSSVWKFNNIVDVRRHISLDQPCRVKLKSPAMYELSTLRWRRQTFANSKHSSHDPCICNNWSFLSIRGLVLYAFVRGHWTFLQLIFMTGIRTNLRVILFSAGNGNLDAVCLNIWL